MGSECSPESKTGRAIKWKEWKRHAAIVLAAGKGSRMKCDVPKQYLSLKGKPVLYYALKAFEESFIDEIVLVTGVGQEEYCQKEIVEHYGFQKVSHVIAGGEERYHSVYAGNLRIGRC